MRLADNQHVQFLPISTVNEVYSNKPDKAISHIFLTGSTAFSH